MFGKSIARDQFHTYFEEYLKQIHPSKELIQIFEKAVVRAYEIRKKDELAYKDQLQKDMKKVDNKITKFIERI